MTIQAMRLKRPEKYNALTLEMLQELIDIVNKPDKTRILLLSGEGPHFCAGADLKGDVPKIFELIAKLYQAILDSPKIVIALIDGYCIAGGFGLAAAADLALATPEASFSLPETRRGLVAPLAAMLASHALPKRLLLQLTLSGEPLPASRLYEVGFINQIVPRDQLEHAGETLAKNILKGGPEATKLTKKMLTPTTFLDEALEWQKKAVTTGEPHEGLAAFREKRAPSWVRQIFDL